MLLIQKVGALDSPPIEPEESLTTQPDWTTITNGSNGESIQQSRAGISLFCPVPVCCLLFFLSLNLFLIIFYPSSSPRLKKKYSGNIGFPFFPLPFSFFFFPLPSWKSTLLREPHYWVPFCIHQPCSAARNKPSVIQDRVLSLDPPIHPLPLLSYIRYTKTGPA
ncbi:hypothetical protein F5X96DRAFT_273405 [Biscogniauxia mediterranea]|nr:hypothetical protein F5X96DRAFT_273405 [Biscogniauxia mediterranea]